MIKSQTQKHVMLSEKTHCQSRKPYILISCETWIQHLLDDVENNERLFLFDWCVGSCISNKLFTLKFKHVVAKGYLVLSLRSNKSIASASFYLLFALIRSASGNGEGGSRRSVSFVMERMRPLLLLFLLDNRIQWSIIIVIFYVVVKIKG